MIYVYVCNEGDLISNDFCSMDRNIIVQNSNAGFLEYD